MNNLLNQLDQNIVNENDIQSMIHLINTNQQSIDTSDLSRYTDKLTRILNNPNYHSLDPSLLVIQLYTSILNKLDIRLISDIFPMKVIIDKVRDNNQFTLLLLQVITLKIESVTEIENFDLLLLEILKGYLQCEDLSIQICSQIESLLQTLDSTILKLMNQKPFQILFENVKNSGNAILIARLLNLISLSCEFVHFNYDFPIDPDNDDVLSTLVIIQFYTTLIDKVPMETLNSAISTITTLFLEKSNLENIRFYLITDISNFLIKLSYNTNLNFLKPHNFSADEDVYFLSKFNANLVDDDFLEFLLDLPLFNPKFFPILLNLVKSEVCLPTIIEREILTNTSILKLVIDQIYQLLINLSSTHKGVTFLLNLPQIMHTYVINHDIVFNDIYNLKVHLLESLIFKNNDLLIWENQIAESYKLMKNGKSIRNEPQVHVSDEAA